MAGNAERLNANQSPESSADAQPQSSGETTQQNWDVTALFESNSRSGAKKLLSEDSFGIQNEQIGAQKVTTYTSPFAVSPETETYKTPGTQRYVTPGTESYKSPFAIAPKTETYNSPFASFRTSSPTETYTAPYTLPKTEPNAPLSTRLEPLDRERTTMEILNKPLADLNADDFGDISKNLIGTSKELLSSVDSDYAGMAGFVVRYKSEMLRLKFPANSSLIAGIAAVPLTGVSAYMLKSDVESFNKTTSIGQKTYYATASAVDATALGATVGTLIPRARAVAGTTAALSFLARAGMGWTHHTFFPDSEPPGK